MKELFPPVWHQSLSAPLPTVVGGLALLDLMVHLALSPVAVQNVVVVVVVTDLLLVSSLSPPSLQASCPPL